MLALCSAAVLVAFAYVQTASLAVFSTTGVPGSLPARMQPQLGERMYASIARVAPAPYVIDMLVRAAYQRGDLQAARARALQLPPGAARDEWLARIAGAAGDQNEALHSFLRAGDADAVQARIDRLGVSDPHAAIALENRLIVRMRRDGDHPDAVADAVWHLGVLLASSGDKTGALRAFKEASALGPLNARYLLSLAAEENDLGMTAAAKADRRRARDADPRLVP